MDGVWEQKGMLMVLPSGRAAHSCPEWGSVSQVDWRAGVEQLRDCLTLLAQLVLVLSCSARLGCPLVPCATPSAFL